IHKAFALGVLDLIPLLKSCLCCMGGPTFFAKDVRVTRDELLAYFFYHIIYCETLLFFSKLAKKDDIVKKIAKLFNKMGVIALVYGFEHFVGLFKKSSSHGEDCLVAVPGTPFRTHQIFCCLEKFSKFGNGLFH